MARNPRRGDGSAPAIGELGPETDSLPRNRRAAPAGFSTSNFGTGPSADAYAEHARTAAQAAVAHNAGASDGSAPAPGLEALLSGDVPLGGSGTAGSGNTWSDSSSQSR